MRLSQDRRHSLSEGNQESYPFSVNSSGLKLSAVLHTPLEVPFPVTVCCHGFLSHKDGQKYKRLAQLLTKDGLGVVRFDFRGCGESEGQLSKSDVSSRLADLKNVIEAIHDLPGFNQRLGLMGSSLGGFLAILAALECPDVEALSLWATPVSLKQLSSRLQESPLLPFSPSKKFLEDLEHYEPGQQLKKIRKALVLHGARDDLVDPSNAWTIFKNVSHPKSLHILSETDHRFSQEKSRAFAFNLTCRWFKRYLG